MPESFINLTEGSGKKTHTFQRTVGANTVEQEQNGVALPYLATYTISATAISAATAASHMLQIMAGASLNVYITRIAMYQTQTATAAAIDGIEIVRLTTAGTGGTVVTPAPRDQADAASGTTAMTLPTVKGTEGVVVDRASGQWTQTVATQNTGLNGTLICEFDYARIFGKPLRIGAGIANGIALKNPTARANAQCTVVAYIIEANY